MSGSNRWSGVEQEKNQVFLLELKLSTKAGFVFGWEMEAVGPQYD